MVPQLRPGPCASCSEHVERVQQLLEFVKPLSMIYLLTLDVSLNSFMYIILADVFLAVLLVSVK